MAKKKIEPIESLGNTDKLTVQKSKPLFALWQSDLTLAEFKILDTYLGRINSRDKEHRTVVFERGELEELLGIQRIRTEVLDERLKNLMSPIKIPNKKNKRGFSRLNLFEIANADIDENGIWKVELTCTPTAKQYIFNLEEIKYLRYKLKNVINIKSRYTYIMFLYLWENKYRGSWQIPLEELKDLLNCNEEYCNKFKVFNDRVLKRIHKEINEVTDIQYNYETIKKGRNVVAIKFIYQGLKENNQLEGQEEFTTVDSFDEYIQSYSNEPLWYSAITDSIFSKEQLEELDSVVSILPDEVLPEATSSDMDNIDIRRYHYINQKYKILKRHAAEKKINNQFTYFKKMIENDL